MSEMIYQHGRRSDCTNCNRRMVRYKDDEGGIHEECISTVSEYPFDVCAHQDWEIYFIPDTKKGAKANTGRFARKLRSE